MIRFAEEEREAEYEFKGSKLSVPSAALFQPQNPGENSTSLVEWLSVSVKSILSPRQELVFGIAVNMVSPNYLIYLRALIYREVLP